MSTETVFSVFCIESYKAYRSLTGRQTVELFRRYGVFDYLREFYDVLHTTGYQYINRDIDIYLKSRNAVIPGTTNGLPAPCGFRARRCRIGRSCANNNVNIGIFSFC